MPLVRLQVRNEFGLGQPELYREANREDPKAVLDGVAVAGLVGILRQLGDLADFAAEVFHGLQEQVMTTASRSRRLMVRVQNIEASLPPLEKAVLAQTSHIHFAYTSGCEWHPRIKTARNHFIYNDLPHFIMDSYEECHDPPRLHFLDKFDTGGPGSCFKRYSDPAFFKKASADSDEIYSEKTEKARKSHKNKKKRSSRKNGELSRREQMHSNRSRMQFISPTANGQLSSSQSATTIDMKMKSDMEVRSSSFDSKAGAGYIECVFHPSYSVQSNEQDHREPPSSRPTQKTAAFRSVSPLIDDSVSHGSLEKKIGSSSSCVTWDQKEDIVESTSQASVKDNTPERIQEKHDYDVLANEDVNIPNVDCHDILFDEESNQKPDYSRVQTDDVDSEPDSYVDALNTIESETVESELENEFAYETKPEEQEFTHPVMHGRIENEVSEAPPNIFNNDLCDAVTQNGYIVSLNKETGRDFPEAPQENHHLRSEPHEPEVASVSPSDVIDGEEMIGDTDSLNKEIFSNLSDSLQDPSVRSDPHESDLGPLSLSNVPDGHEMTSEAVSLNKETFGNIPGSPQKIASVGSVSDVSNLASMDQLDFPASDEMTNVADSHSFESPICEQVPLTRESSVLDHPICTDSFIGSHTAKDTVSVDDTVSAHLEVDTSLSDSKSSNLAEEVGRIDSNNCKSEEAPRESSSDRSVRFWTNGGLLGLEPSKPPDFNTSSSLSQGSLPTKSEVDVGSHNKSMQKSNGYKMGQDLPDEVVERILKESSSRCLTSNHNDDQACISSKNSGSSQPSNVCSQTERNALGEIRVSSPGNVLPSGPEPNHGNSENSSRVFGLGHRLLLNSFQRKVSLDERSATSNSLKSILLDESVQNGIAKQSLPEATVKEKANPGYPIDSLPPSPPLEHMKISFHPVSGHETSKLKLKFPEGSNHREHIRDMFPSFQLVPESSIPLDDAGSHSDGDDTFCRSSPYLSDDCLSPHSDDNSDQWESEETPESSDHGVYDSPHRRSSSESMLSTKEHGGLSHDATNVEPYLSVPSLDFPSFENVNPVLERESSKQSQDNNAVVLRSNPESAPPPPRPPPPPPTQWRVSKPQLDTTNGTQHYVSEDSEHIHDGSLPQSTLFQQSRLARVEQMQINDDNYHSQDSIIHKLKDKLDMPKLKSPREINQLRAAKGMDEREDFLHQIRAKSMNLRRTATEKQNNATAMGPAASDKVSAILEKANAIRQVVASDDGEDDDDDDTWSDS
ncbi:protein SCAR3 [Arachis duranensis]|uniref:Protein SCAR n=1 Tax=Arachis duranensis TaxID=130453 RepID=A0A6P4CWH6_ARADU|nr:protein SCAR3 [Arachis duranensis]